MKDGNSLDNRLDADVSDDKAGLIELLLDHYFGG